MRSKLRIPIHTYRAEHSMLDLMMVAIALGFFVIALGYVIACDRM